jgi:hypothetical protein
MTADRADEDDALSVPAAPEQPLFDPREFEIATGEAIERVLNLGTWRTAERLGELYQRLEEQVQRALAREDGYRREMRRTVFPRLRDTSHPEVPPNAGVYQATLEEIEQVHRGLLFTGQVEACDGTHITHDTLPLTVVQIGICLVSYRGDQCSLVQRVLRRDLPFAPADPVQEALAVLERRQRRAGLEQERAHDTLSDLAPRGIMAYAERAALVERSTAPWRMGHGNPTPYELLTGSGMIEILDAGLDVLDRLVQHKRFVFVPSAAQERAWLTIANALRPLEYAIFRTQRRFIEGVRDTGRYRGTWAALERRRREFIDAVGPQVVMGAYRASEMAPPQLFYAHVEHAHEAALIALADSTLQEHRGFPLLIDVADLFCRTTFDAATFNAVTQLAYVDAGHPFRYLAERRTRA